MGAQHLPGALAPCLADLLAALAPLPAHEAGVRLRAIDRLGDMLGTGGCVGNIARAVLGREARPVRAILFNKSRNRNWALGWHQDRTICVRQRLVVPGFESWTVKAGMLHVEPPIALLGRMITLRAHLDDVPPTNAPLKIAPGSHRLGRIPEPDIAAVVASCGTVVCTAQAGDVWLYATPILHASDAAERPRRRRVLQVDYAAEPLPHGLEWLGI